MRIVDPDRPPMIVEPVTLEGEGVRLEPLDRTHLPGLIAVGLDPELWRWTLTRVDTRDDLRRYLEAALANRSAGTELPFAIVDRRSGRLAGSRRYLNIDAHHRRLEVGYTWVGRRWQGTGANTEAKLLLLGHAFERLGAHRVEFKTDSLNLRSRAALRAVGATEEGTLRNHMVTEGGRLRHTVYFSVIDSEWARVEAHLRRRLERQRAAGTDDHEAAQRSSGAGEAGASSRSGRLARTEGDRP